MKYLLIFLTLFLLCCKKENSGTAENTIQNNATIVWTRAVALDGCDWLVKIDSLTYYHPDELTEEFKQDSLQVQVTYTITGDAFHCGLGGAGLPVIHVVAIKK